MTDQTDERELFLHADRDKAVLVSKTCHRGDAEVVGNWLPKSQIIELGRRVVQHPRFGESASCARDCGTAIRFRAPSWLLERKGLTEDLELPL